MSKQDSFTRQQLLLKLFSLANINVSSLSQLAYLEIDRDYMKDPQIVNRFYNFIPDLKTAYNSDMFTCLHKNSLSKQKQPAICMLRQMLKANDYHLKPVTLSLGYNKVTGKKIVKRSFIIQPL
tara:strand:+ start:2471 stop:2839 length:369 start_codon:yes stop_codon:yes gene_type:complete